MGLIARKLGPSLFSCTRQGQLVSGGRQCVRGSDCHRSQSDYIYPLSLSGISRRSRTEQNNKTHTALVYPSAHPSIYPFHHAHPFGATACLPLRILWGYCVMILCGLTKSRDDDNRQSDNPPECLRMCILRVNVVSPGEFISLCSVLWEVPSTEKGGNTSSGSAKLSLVYYLGVFFIEFPKLEISSSSFVDQNYCFLSIVIFLGYFPTSRIFFVYLISSLNWVNGCWRKFEVCASDTTKRLFISPRRRLDKRVELLMIGGCYFADCLKK